MKKIATILAALVAMTIGVNAQEVNLDGYLYPASGNVYVADQYDGILSVSYDLPLAYDGEINASIYVDGDIIPLTGTATAGEYSIIFPIEETLQDERLDYDLAFTVTISPVTLGYFTEDWVEDEDGFWSVVRHLDSTVMSNDVTGSYYYMEAFPTFTFTPSTTQRDTTVFDIVIVSDVTVYCDYITFTSSSRLGTPVVTTQSINQTGTSFIGHITTNMWDLEQLPATMVVEAEMSINGYTLPAAVTNYQYGYAPAAEYVGTDPESTYNAALLYDNYFMMNFLYTSEIEISEDLTYSAQVVFYGENGVISTIDVPTAEVWAGYDWWNGYYTISVPTYELPDGAVRETISLFGIKTAGQVMSLQPSVTYLVQPIEEEELPEIEQQSAPRSAQFGASNGRVDVYSMKSGAMVRSQMQKSDVKNLPAGFYIVKDGEVTTKVFVR